MKRLIALTALCIAAQAHAQTPTPPSSPAKKELIAKVLQLQQGDIEALARNLAQEPAARMMQEANRILQSQVPADKRESVGKSIEASAKKYVDEAVPLVKERALKLAPTTLGSSLEERFTEDELKIFVAWLESPVYRKYQQVAPEFQRNFVQKLVADARPGIDPKLKSLEESVRTALASAGSTSSSGSTGSSGSSGSAAKPAAKAASK